MRLKTTDSPANANEYIANAAKTLGRSEDRHKVFEAIYRGKKQVKTVVELMAATNLTRIRVLQEGGVLAAHEIVDKEKVNSQMAYRKRDFLQHNRDKILRLARDPKKLDAFPTKWAPKHRAQGQTVTIRVNPKDVRIRQITVDEIASFSAVKSHSASGNIGSSVSEEQFKQGIQKIIGQPGSFKDWGGEVNDLFTTRVRVGGKRRATAFGFKGPGTKGELTLKKMGKNGDQVQRLFESPAQVFLVQYWREINPAVLRQMELLAAAKSLLGHDEIFYGIIDGEDSNRIYLAYRSKFS